jgi:CheY-like chemotaxis protein
MKDTRVLLVEDDKLLRRACGLGLKRRGYTVLTAVDGEEAIEIAHTGCPDIILLDMLMPKLSGKETLVVLKNDEQTRHIPVVILSNSSLEADIKEAKDLGAIGYLVKASLSLQELGDRVSAYIGEFSRPANLLYFAKRVHFEGGSMPPASFLPFPYSWKADSGCRPFSKHISAETEELGGSPSGLWIELSRAFHQSAGFHKSAEILLMQARTCQRLNYPLQLP